MKAIWSGKTIAKSIDTKLVEGNHNIPSEAATREYLKESDTHSDCPWKGTASYYHPEVGSEVNKDAAWFYPEPSEAASETKDNVDF